MSGFSLAAVTSAARWEDVKREGRWDTCISCLWAWLQWDLIGKTPLILASFDGQFSCTSGTKFGSQVAT